MTDKFKKRVREHAEKHGMNYQAARQQLETREDEPSSEPDLEPIPSDGVFGQRLLEIEEKLRDPDSRMAGMAALVMERMRTRRCGVTSAVLVDEDELG